MTAWIIRAARIAALRVFIDQLNSFMVDEHKYQPKAMYHLSGIAEDFCEPCAEKAADEIHASNPSMDPRSYPHTAFEREEPAYCAGCRCLLAHSLSPDGAVHAIHAFIDEDKGFRGALLPEEAYMVHQILMALHDLARFGADDDLDEVWSGDYRNAVTLGEMAVAAIHLEPEQLDLFAGGPDGQETDVAGSERSSSQADGPD